MKGLFIPGITAEMFRNGSLESIETLMSDGEMQDIEYPTWIPTSERLPEEDQVVLGTDSYNCFYNTYTWDDCGEIKWYADGDYDVPIVAWMPLPKPYREGEKE